MKIEVFVDADSVAREAAALIAVSGGHTPWIMLSALAEEDVPCDKVHIIQVDERVAPAGHPDRNLTHLRESLLEHVPLPPKQIYAKPVESPDLEAAAKQYAARR
jgi:6-phosphogluconolactonase